MVGLMDLCGVEFTSDFRFSRQERRLFLPQQPGSYWHMSGRACGSYNSKEINLKVVGSSPTFGYSYIKAHQRSCSFAFWPSAGCLQSPDQDNSLLTLLARQDKRVVSRDRY
jgi:hypothetical protein